MIKKIESEVGTMYEIWGEKENIGPDGESTMIPYLKATVQKSDIEFGLVNKLRDKALLDNEIIEDQALLAEIETLE